MQLLKYNKITIGLFLLIAVGAVWSIVTGLKFQHDIDSFLPKGEDDIAILREMQEELEADDAYYLIAIENEAGIFQKSFLKRIDSLGRVLEKVERVERVTSLATLKNPIKTPFMMATVPVLHLDQPSRYAQDSANIMQDDRLLGRFISRDGRSLVVALALESGMPQKEAVGVDQEIQSILSNFAFDNVHTVGKANIQSQFVALLQGEMTFYMALCSLFLVIALIIIFRRFWTVTVAYFSVVLGAVLFFSILSLIGRPLDLMATLFPLLMLIVGMSDVVHFLSKYMDELKGGYSKIAAMKTTIREIGIATLLTSITTAIGFASLYLSRIEPISAFGISAAIGVFVAYLTVLLFTTATLLLFKPSQIIPKKGFSDERWNRFLRWNFFFVKLNKRRIVIATIGVLVLASISIMNISTNTFVLSDIPEDSKLMNDVRFFEEYYSGVRSYELAIRPQGEQTIENYEVLQQIDKLERYLVDSTPITSIISPVTAYRTMHRAHKGNQVAYFKLPETEAVVARYREDLKRFGKNNISKVISEDGKLGRLTGMMVDLGSEKIAELNKQIASWMASNLDIEVVKFETTGTAVLMDRNNFYLRRSLVESLGFAVIVVSLVMGLLFRNWRMVIISLVPNLLPLLIAAAVIGVTGIELKSSTSIIFAIAFGIAVDDTIHFLSKYKLERDKGYGINGSLYHTFMETGKALYLTSIILFLGFTLLVFSDFKSVYYIGFLVSLTLMVAIVSCLTLTPLLINRLLKDNRRVDFVAESELQARLDAKKSLEAPAE